MIKKDLFCPRCQVKYKSTSFEFCRYCGGKLEDYPNGKVASYEGKPSKRSEQRTYASWGWVAAIVVYTASILLLFLLQNLLSYIGSYIYSDALNVLLIFRDLPASILSYMVPAYRVLPVLGSTIYVAGPEFLVFITLAELGLLVGPLLLLKYRGRSIKELGFDFEDKKEVRNDVIVGALGGSLMMIISFAVSLITSYTLEGLYSPIDIYLSRLFSSVNDASFMSIYFYQYILLVLSMILLVAPCEEISTRAFLQQGLENGFGRWAGLIVTAIIFSALHIFLYPTNAGGLGFPPYVGSISAILAIPSYLALSFTLGILLQVRKYRIITTITAHAFYMIILVSIYFISMLDFLVLTKPN